MRRILEPHGYTVAGLPVRGCLHLKSAVTEVAEETLLIQPQWVDRDFFSGYSLIEVDPDEAYAANALRIGDRAIYPISFPKTAERLRSRGIDPAFADVSELAKAEGAVTCCSLIFDHAGG